MSKDFSALNVREDFIRFFRQNSHKLIKASKVFDENDKSLLFVNAGMNQFKSEFLLKDVEEKEESFRRLCNSQICIRAGGKHNDLDDVGFDSYHLTSFEMLGSWSINSYQKKEAIRLAFTYLTEQLKLNPSKMYATYFGGDETEGLEEDTETKNIWLDYLPTERIVKGNFKDNFWMMAETGPCGMCTEIHYDLDLDKNDRLVPELVNKDDPKVVEIWNVVFIQYERLLIESKYSYERLQRFFVDTGMGLERLCMVLQKTSSVYKTDVFHYLMGYAQAMTNCKHLYTDCYDKSNTNYDTDCAYRIFCDHFRTVVVVLFEGGYFDGVGRGHVLRKIFRRMLTHVYLYLNKGVIEQLMTKPIILGIITDILNYHLKRVHDNVEIQNKLIAEERLFLGCLQNFRREMISVLETNKKDGSLDRALSILNERNLDQNKSKAMNLCKKLMSNGVPLILIQHSEQLVIKPIKS